MLARLLHTHNIPCTIFEGETSIDYRSQGGTLDLRAKTGLHAIKQAELWEEFQKCESLLITDKKLTTWMRRSPGRPDQGNSLQVAPEIDRCDLRRILMESLPKETIRWGLKLAHVQETNAGHELHFSNGKVERGYDLIVGCDGAWSKTRTFLTPETPHYTGLGGWTMQIPNAQVTAPEVYNFVNRGSVFAFSDGKFIAIQQLSSGDIWISTYAQQPERFSRFTNADKTDTVMMKKELAEQFCDWVPQLRGTFDKVQGDAVQRQLYMVPTDFTWPHKRGVTLLGDAAHLMTPFSGIGVNTAFHDALLLSHQIIDCVLSGTVGNLDDFVHGYEEEMFVNAHKAMEQTEGSMNDMMFTPGAPRTSIASYMCRFARADLPTWLHPIVTVIVHAGFRVYGWFV